MNLYHRLFRQVLGGWWTLPAEIVDSHAICDVGEKVGAGKKVQVCLACSGGKVVSDGQCFGCVSCRLLLDKGKSFASMFL
jgi:hypothetical protein